jgi:2,3-dihydroxybenzoate decarboxylase
VSEYIQQNIPITSSGMAWAPVIQFCQQVLGMDRVMYAMDYPNQFDAAEVTVTDDMAISDADKKKFYQTNAERIFNLT